MTENQIQLTGIIINSIVASSALATLIYQRIFNTKTLDYNLHPVFTISDFCPNDGKFWTPKLCEASDPNSKHYCTDDHWFNLTNNAPGYAFEFSCFLIHKKEINENFDPSKFHDRIIKRETLVRNGRVQYKIAINEIPFRFYNKSSTDEFYIIVEYKTVNSKSKFRQIITLTSTPMNENNQINDWKSNIKLNFPEVSSLKKIHWWENNKKTMIKELKKIKD